MAASILAFVGLVEMAVEEQMSADRHLWLLIVGIAHLLAFAFIAFVIVITAKEVYRQKQRLPPLPPVSESFNLKVATSQLLNRIPIATSARPRYARQRVRPMCELFNGWRRTVGLVALGSACVLMAGWIRSEVVGEVLALQPYSVRCELASDKGNLAFRQCTLRPGQSFWNGGLLYVGPGPAGPFEFFKITSESTFVGVHTATGHIQNCPPESGAEMNPMVLGEIIEFAVPYWALVAVLTLLSFWLLLKKPRPTKGPESAESSEL